MRSPKCQCGHEKQDHQALLHGTHRYGPCKVCLCDQFTKVKPSPDVVPARLAATRVLS